MKTKTKPKPLTAKRARYLKNKYGFQYLLDSINHNALIGLDHHYCSDLSTSHLKKLQDLGYKVFAHLGGYRIKW